MTLFISSARQRLRRSPARLALVAIAYLWVRYDEARDDKLYELGEKFGRDGRVKAPVLVVHSRDDGLVPFSHGRRLYEAAEESRDQPARRQPN